MPSPQPELVGRDAELGAVEGFLARSADLPPSTLVITGEAGIGKTTLWRDGLRRAETRGYRLLVARPASAESEMPFAGLGDLLANVGEAVLELPEPQRRALQAALLLAEPDIVPPQPHTIAAAVLSCLRELSRRDPILVGVDDAQWLDSASAAALRFALRRTEGDGRMLFLLSWRTDGKAPLPFAEDVRDGTVERLAVGPLSLGALHRIITARLGHPLARPLLTRVRVASDGNPFFAIELAQVAESRGTPAEALELPLPASLSDALRERLAAVPDESKDALLLVATCVTPTLELIESALGPEGRRALQPSIEAGMLVIDHDRLRFAHPLIAAAVLADAPPERRRLHHLALAGLVGDLDEQAHHLARGSTGTNADLALTLETAAHRARRRGAPEAAAALVDRSWAATPPDNHDDAWRRAVLASEWHLQSGDMVRFRELADVLLAIARTGDERSFACQVLSLAHEGDETEQGWLERALSEADSARQRQSVESDYVTFATVGGDLTAGLHHARESLRLAEELADPSTLADALSSLARLEQLLGLGLRRDLLHRIDALHELRATDRLEETVGLIRTTVAASGLLATADEFPEARRRSARLQDVLERQGLVQALPEVLRFRAELECLAGDWDLAHDLALAGDELAEQTGRSAIRGDLLYPRVFVVAHRGQHEPARALALEAVRTAEEAGNHRNLLRQLALLGFISLSLDNLAEALEPLERAAALAASAGFVEPNWLRFHDDLGAVLVGVGRLDEAAALVAWLDERGAASGYPWTLAAAARCRGQLCSARGELDAAESTLQTAITHGRRVGNPFELARTRLDLGRVHRAARRRAKARTVLSEALACFEELGAELWASTARRELDRISGRRVEDPDELTEAEARIAELVAAGASNKEAAAALQLTVKTVEVTLTRVYRKLGVRSRSELAALFAGRAKL